MIVINVLCTRKFDNIVLIRQYLNYANLGVYKNILNHNTIRFEVNCFSPL